MTQENLFDDKGKVNENAMLPDPSPECSAEAREKIDEAALERLVEKEYQSFPEGAIAEDIVARIRRTSLEHRHITVLSIRPRQTALKRKKILFATGDRRTNGGRNTCAVLLHKNFWTEPTETPTGGFDSPAGIE